VTRFTAVDAFIASYRWPIRLQKPVSRLDSDNTVLESDDSSDNKFSSNQTDNVPLNNIFHESASIDRAFHGDTSSIKDDLEYTVVIDNDSDLDLRDGSLSFPDTLLVQGSLKVGKLRCTRENLHPKGAKVKVATGGYLGATLYCAEQVEIWGELHGNIHCETLLLGPDAIVEGNIETKFLQVVGGASISGSIKTGKVASTFDHRKQEKVIIEPPKKNLGEMNPPLTIIQEVTKKRAEKPVIMYQNGTQRMSANEFYKPRKDSLDGLFGTAWRNASNRGDLLSSSGKYLDSFGNPLIVEADEETVKSFREVRRFSYETRTLLDAHLRKKEKDKMLKLTSNGVFGFKRLTPEDHDIYEEEQSEDEKNTSKDDPNEMPKFMR
jgi:cytoskeletal protein CcmA (bactofilin family)